MTDLFIHDLAVELPATSERVTDLLTAHPMETERLSRMGYEAVAVETEHRTAGQLAIAAVRRLSKSVDTTLKLVLHASVHDQGMGVFWNPATAVQAELGAMQAIPMALRQGCDGLLLGLHFACRYLAGHGRGQAVLVGSDRFSGSGFCRVTADYGILYGDGAAALTIGTDPGLARILAVETITDPTLCALHDGSGFDANDVRSAKRRFLELHGRERLRDSTRAALAQLNRKLFADATDEEAVRRILFPHLGLDLLRENYFPAFIDGEMRGSSALGAEVGHLGTADQFVTLYALIRDGGLMSGDRVLLVGAGAGFSWTGILLEICQCGPEGDYRACRKSTKHLGRHFP